MTASVGKEVADPSVEAAPYHQLLHLVTGVVLDLLYPRGVATPAPRTETLCHNWEALKSAAEKEELAYEFDGHQVHVWIGRPQRGDRCGCGARAWA